MIVVTGGAGFIGSNIIKGLNDRGITNIVVVDDLKEGIKYRNIVDLEFVDYMDHKDFINRIHDGNHFSSAIDAIFHQGACSNTMEWDGTYLLDNNYNYSKSLYDYCQLKNIPLYYASSAAIYGDNRIFKEEKQYENPLNLYGYSKLLFDRYVQRNAHNAKSQVVGLRYFNVYGPREFHKAGMQSAIRHFYNQLVKEGKIDIFVNDDDKSIGPGEQSRDFVFIGDVVKVNLWFFDHRDKSGIFNCGTGTHTTFNAIAQSMIDWYGSGEICYVPMPQKLRGCYQNYTKADIVRLRAAGYDQPFATIREGIEAYFGAMEARELSSA